MKYIKLLPLLLLLACSNNSRDKDKVIDLFNNTYFTLEKGEKPGKITPQVKERYVTTIESKVQIPLFRYVKHEDYEMFIGIPVNTSFNEIITGSFDSMNQQLAIETDSKTNFYLSEKADSVYIIKYIREIEDNLISITALTKSETVKDSIFNYKAIAERLKIKK